MMAQWPHLYPSRTQKLSTVAAKIAQANLARCRVIESMVFHRSPFFYSFYGFRLTHAYIDIFLTNIEYLMVANATNRNIKLCLKIGSSEKLNSTFKE